MGRRGLILLFFLTTIGLAGGAFAKVYQTTEGALRLAFPKSEIQRKTYFLNEKEIREIEKRYAIEFKEYFKEEFGTLQEFVKDDIVQLSDTSITITELGHQFANLVCRDFDKFYNANKKARDFGAFFQEEKTIPETAKDIQKRLVERQ